MMKKILTIIILCSVFVFSCNDDYLDIESTQYVTADQLSAETVQPLITGLYEWLIKYNSHNRTGKLKPRHIDFGLMALHWRTDLMNDDMIMVNKGYHWGFTDYNFTGRDAGDVDVAFFWNYLYKMIKASNRILTNVPEKIKADQKPIYGQAYAFRGLGYHYLVRCFAHTYIGHQQDPGVPIITEKTTQEQILNNPRAKVEEVYKQIKSDYDKASELLAGWTRANKSIIDQSVVEGFKARMYLEMEQYGEAIKCAQKVISLTDCQLMSRDDYKSGFNDIGNVEWIWGAIVTKESQIATSGIINFFSHISTTAYGYVAAGAMWKAIDARLYNAIPATDVRKEVFLSEPKEVITPWGPKTADKYVNMKFLPLPNSSQDEDMPFMRLAEIYLIMAEAKAMNGDADAAKWLYDFNITRDPSYVKSANTGKKLADEARYYRQIELWGEGFSYFDHKRLNKPITRAYEGSNHHTDVQKNYPVNSNVYRLIIPRSEIETNEGISQADQNPVQD